MRTNSVFLALSIAIFFSVSASAQIAGTDRDVQIRSIDFISQTLELHNFGTSTRTLDGWRFCSHDELSGFRYTGSTGLNGQSLDSGDSLFIDWDNNGTGANTLDVSSLGGNAIDDLFAAATGEAVQIGIYIQGGFGNAANLADHVQYSFDGIDVDGADNRGTVAETAELWTDQNDWISVNDGSTGLVLNADPFPGAGASHGVGSYSVSVPEPSTIAFLCLGLMGSTLTRRRK
jgi:hypothetical protein